MIALEQFLCKWKEAWRSVEKDEAEKLFRGQSTPWTKFMLTGDDAFLKSVGDALIKKSEHPNRHISQEDGGYFRIDLVFITDRKDGYPRMLDVVIEHENDQHPENEMWKLMLVRSPLKVIIFYNQDPEEKIKKLFRMLDEANKKFGENSTTEYLIIVGNNLDDGQIRWRWASDKKRELRELC